MLATVETDAPVVTVWLCHGWSKLVEEDDYEGGITGQGATEYGGTETWTDPTLAGLLARLLTFTGAGPDALEVDACEEPGRVDIQLYENDATGPPSPDEWESWKRGERTLWAVTYTFYVVQTVQRPIAREWLRDRAAMRLRGPA